MILLVEDNADDEKLVLRALAQSNLLSKLVVARDGLEAIDYLFGEGRYSGCEIITTPALILLDLSLPEISGLEVLRRIRADTRTRLIPVVVLTGSKNGQDLIASYSLGANSYVSKPVDFVQLAELVGQVARYWMEINIAPPEGGYGVE